MDGFGVMPEYILAAKRMGSGCDKQKPGNQSTFYGNHLQSCVIM